MIAAMIQWAFRFRWVVLLISVLICLLGAFLFRHMKIEAYPDISSVSVTIVTQFPGRAPEEVERQITVPIELAHDGRPARRRHGVRRARDAGAGRVRDAGDG